ncbi:MAG TPA: HD-GYP domain-containing protein [Oscillospiraceae bacterium]|nr:HD-GYP domain-containing protein [Oscillospiraceae bacterium]
MSFSKEPLASKIYISVVSIAAITFLFFHLPTRQMFSVSFFFFVILHIMLDQLDVPLPRGNSAVSVNFAVDLALIMLFGPTAAAWAGLSTVLNIRSLKSFRESWYKMLFNASQMALATGLAGHAFILTGGINGRLNLSHDIVPILVSTFVFFFINTTLVMLAVTFSQKVSFMGVWLTSFKWSVPNYLSNCPLGVLIAVVFNSMAIPGVLLLIVPLMVARHTFIMYMDMRNQYMSTIKALTKAIDAKDHYTRGHSERVAKYTVWIGEELHLPEDYLEQIEYIALMHDIGKIGVPEHILNKPSRLSDEEYHLVMEHSAVGAEIISNIKFIGEHADIVRHHHERVDGSGYPDGLTEKEISLGAKMIGVADAYDAMTSERIYRAPLTKAEAVAELQRCSNSQFSEEIVKAFLKVLRRKGEIE